MVYKIKKKQNNSGKCFVCGIHNEFGLKARFYECENETEEAVLLTIVEPHNLHQSYPNRMHGGIVAALLDESVGRAVQIDRPEIWGVTIDLNIKYRNPTPLDQMIYIESKITKITHRFFEGEGKIFTSSGTVLANATCKFLILPIKKIAGGELGESDWFYVEEELPNEIVISAEEL